MSVDLPEDREIVAAEIAFGLADDAERRAADARAAADPAFAAAVDRWREHATTLAIGAGEAPSPSLWAIIAAQLPANDLAPRPVAANPAGSGRLRPFLAGALAASVLCGLVSLAAQRAFDLVPAATERARLAGILDAERRDMRVALAAERRRAGTTLVAVLTGGDRRDSVTISFDPATGKLIAAPAKLGVGRAAAAELWVIPADGKPRSLGVIAAAAPGVPHPRAGSAAALAAGVTLAVSLEPSGGSPGDAPSGPVILTGKMTPI